MQTRYPLTVFICAGLLSLLSCNGTNKPASNLPPGFDEASIRAAQQKYNAAIQSGIHGISYPGQFNRLFPGASNGISYYTGVVGKPKWYSKIGLNRRYVLRLFVDIELDGARTNIVSTGPPSGDLCELTSITPHPSGAMSIAAGKGWKLTSDDWKRLFEAHGDFGVLGITLETNKPVEGFDAAWWKF